jgi:hypothetical protein
MLMHHVDWTMPSARSAFHKVVAALTLGSPTTAVSNWCKLAPTRTGSRSMCDGTSMATFLRAASAIPACGSMAANEVAASRERREIAQAEYGATADNAQQATETSTAAEVASHDAMETSSMKLPTMALKTWWLRPTAGSNLNLRLARQ